MNRVMGSLLHKFKREMMLIGPFRWLIFKFLEKKLYRAIVEKKDLNWISYNFPRRAREDNFYIMRAILETINRGLNEKRISKQVWRQSFDFISVHLARKIGKAKTLFLKKYGFKPPALLALSPTKLCNLKCLSCYSDSSPDNRETLSFKIVSRIIKEQKELWGSHFTILTGGEPFAYNDGGRTILDLAAKHPDTFFLVYTNGTLINEETAQKLAKLGNITPAISVEGLEKETDERRGQGIHQKILRTFDYLRRAGVLFGVSITPTRKNAELILSDELIDYYFNKIGVAYAWIFQYLAIGRDANPDLMVTPEQRIAMFKRIWQLIKERKLPLMDFWNCGSVIGGCFAAGRPQVGYIHINWNGDVTPCVFQPYSSQSIIEIYKNGGDLNSALFSPFFEKIRQWQKEAANPISCCPYRDHYELFHPFFSETGIKPVDKPAEKFLQDKEYRRQLIDYGRKFGSLSQKIWDEEYLSPEATNKNKRRDNQTRQN